jgi:outer membrane protein OmpA-like peptidoglycan-associated protein
VDECPDYFGNAEHNGCPLPKKELDRMRKIYEHQQLAKQYALDDARNPYNPRNDAFDPTDPYNPFNPRNSAFDVKHPENPFNPDNNYFDINNPHNPYNPKSANYNPKLNDIKEYDPDKHRPKNPSDLDPKDPKNFGRIVIGLPTSEKYGDYYKPKKHGQGSHGGQHIAGNGNSGKGGKGGRSGGIDNPNNPLTFDPNFKYEHTPDSLTGFNPTNIKLTKEEEEYCQRVDLSDLKAAIYFQPSNASANISSLKSLDKIVEAMRRCAILEVQIAGHADADGSDNSNLTLSEKRAKAVLRYITGQGISNKRLKYNAYGEQYPAAPNDNPDGKQQNRRTEIQVRKN